MARASSTHLYSSGLSSKQQPHSETKEMSICDVDMQLPRAYRWKWIGPTPCTKKQLRAFFGLTGYYRRFIADYANIATLLTDLTKKDTPNKIPWTSTCQQAFSNLKLALYSAPILSSPDFNRPFILQIDASDRGVRAVLSQHDAIRQEHPITFFNKKLLPREQNYSTVEKECLAIKLATEAFRVYLLGRPFTIQMDHWSLQWLDKLKDTNSRRT